MLEVTITIKTDDHDGETTMVKTAEYGADNPLYYADAARKLGQRLTNELADRLDTMHPQDARPVGSATV